MYKLFKTSLLLLALTLLAGGCAVQPTATPGDKVTAESAQAALQAGDFERAARDYQALAESAEYSPAEQQRFRLEAVDALTQAEQPARAAQLLDTIDSRLLPPPQQVRLRLLQGRVWLALRNAERVLETLAAPLATGDVVALEEFHRMRAQARAWQDNHLEAAREYMQRGRYLTDDTARADNQQQLWNALSQLPADNLLSQQVTPPPDEFSGWLALAAIGKQYQLGRHALQQSIERWRQSYPQHPVAQQYIDDILRRSTELVLQPKHIALLLPLSGRFAGAGMAVRDGVMAAHYATPAAQRVTISIYDSANPEQVLPNYDQALRDGAEFVIGPLSKEGITALLQRSDFPVPTLVLNTVDTPELPDQLYQLALSPEDEAQQVAERAWLLGHTAAAVFVPEGEWGERIEHAFVVHWKKLGGVVTTQARYDSGKNDFAQPLRSMFNLDQSDARHRRLQGVLGQKLNFEPRRREDMDFIFLAAFPRQARLIRPQIKFHHASDVPVLATSHVYSGAPAQELDRDMDGIIFGDMPWTLKAPTATDATRIGTDVLRTGDNGLQRLLALGSDSYHLIPILKVLEHYPYERFHGETGSLHLDEQRRLNRQLTWARFNGGIPRVIQSDTATQQ